MISYEPLRSHLESIGQTIHYLRKEGLINSNAAKQIADDVPISLRLIADICVFLNISIEQAVIVIQTK